MGLLKPPIKGSKVIFLFVLTNLILAAMLLWSIPQIRLLAQGMEVLDLMPTGYDVDYVTKWLDKLGNEGQNKYLFIQLPLDMVYPLMFGLCYYLMYTWLITKLNALHTLWANISFIPIFVAFFDYLENMGILFIIAGYPGISEGIVKATSIFSTAKIYLTALFYAILLLSFILLLFRRIRN